MAKQKGKLKFKKVTAVLQARKEPDSRIPFGELDYEHFWAGYGWFDGLGEVKKAFTKKYGFEPKKIFRSKMAVWAGPVKKILI